MNIFGRWIIINGLELNGTLSTFIVNQLCGRSTSISHKPRHINFFEYFF